MFRPSRKKENAMTQVYIGQIMMTGFDFAPKAMALCNGQTLAISQNTALFSLLGTFYGGNGIQTFQLPNLQGRAPVGIGPSVDPAWQPSPYVIGTVSGTEQVTLQLPEMPSHNHQVNATKTVGNTKSIRGAGFGSSNNNNIPTYAVPGTQTTALYSTTIAEQGGSLPHNNMQPYRVISFSIALSGIFPSRN
jgi:microcystin-dependent protein